MSDDDGVSFNPQVFLRRAMMNQVRGFETISPLYVDETAARINTLWEFTVRRAALDDISISGSRAKKPRVGAIALYVDMESPEDDVSTTGQQLIELLQRHAADQGLRFLSYKVLEQGSYGAILFVEDTEPTTRKKFLEKIEKATTASLGELYAQARAKVFKGTIGLILTATAIFIGPTVKETVSGVVDLPSVVVMKCDDNRIIDFHNQLLTVKGAGDMNELVNKYCKVVPVDPSDFLSPGK